MTTTETTETKAVLDPGDRDNNGRFGDPFTIEDARNRTFAAGHAPKGGRTVDNGPVHAEPFAFIYATPLVISADGNGMAEYRTAPRLRCGDVVEIKGYGLHRIERDRDGYNAHLVRLSDGFVS